MFLAVSYTSCFLFLPDLLRVVQWMARGLQARRTVLLYFISSHPVNLICILESNLNSFLFYQIPRFSALQSDYINFQSGILSPDDLHNNGSIVIFVRQVLSFEFSSLSHFSLDPKSDYLGVNILLNNSSLYFLNIYSPPICSSLMGNRTDSFTPPFFPPEISSGRTLTAITLSGTQKYLIGSSSLTSCLSIILTCQLISIAPLAVTFLLTSPLLHSLLLSLPTNSTNHFSFSALLPQQTVPFIFQRACWDNSAFYFNSLCPSA